MGGLKRKVPMEKIEKKDSRAVAFSKRRMGLYGKASELCLLSGANIAILATPVSSKSNVSFYSFGGHCSVDSVVSAFLTNQRPPEDLGLGFWWEDESLLKSENLVELRDASDSMSRLMNELKELRSNAVKNRGDLGSLENKNDVVLSGTHQNQTLNLETSSASLCVKDDYLPDNLEDFVKNIEGQILEVSDNDNNADNLHLSDMVEEQTLELSDNNTNNNNIALSGDFGGFNEEFDLDEIFDFVTKSETLSMNLEMSDVSMVSTNQNPCSAYNSAGDEAMMMMHRDLDQAVSDSNNKNVSSTNFDGSNEEFDLDEIFDFETKYEGMNLKMDDASTSQNPCSASETVEDREFVRMQRDLDEDNLHFSDFFTEFNFH